MDVQKFGPESKVVSEYGTGIVWAYESDGVSENGAFSHWNHTYIICYPDGSIKRHKEEELKEAK